METLVESALAAKKITFNASIFTAQKFQSVVLTNILSATKLMSAVKSSSVGPINVLMKYVTNQNVVNFTKIPKLFNKMNVVKNEHVSATHLNVQKSCLLVKMMKSLSFQNLLKKIVAHNHGVNHLQR